MRATERERERERDRAGMQPLLSLNGVKVNAARFRVPLNARRLTGTSGTRGCRASAGKTGTPWNFEPPLADERGITGELQGNW